jgi:hypothetical protein
MGRKGLLALKSSSSVEQVFGVAFCSTRAFQVAGFQAAQLIVNSLIKCLLLLRSIRVILLGQRSHVVASTKVLRRIMRWMLPLAKRELLRKCSHRNTKQRSDGK